MSAPQRKNRHRLPARAGQRRGAKLESDQPLASCPVVGIGASAGGLEAFTELLRTLPARPGVALVLIQHLDPTHTSFLAEAIGKATKLPVQQITDGMVVTPDHVFVIPPNANVGILNGTFTLLARPSHARGSPQAVDFFFKALAADQRHRAIGVVLSGTGTDGTEGLRAIKAEDGVTFAQDPSSAKFDGMPQSAISAGVVDFVNSPSEVAHLLVRIGQHPYVRAVAPEQELPIASAEVDEFRRILFQLRAKAGVDFSEYKPSTIKRRLARRMALRQQTNLADYLAVLEDDPEEAVALHEDMLINVTSFFRDPEVFDNLRSKVLPAIVKQKAGGGAIRVWVPGCATGEEAYSITICLLEVLGRDVDKYIVQVFASDISDKSLIAARLGIYGESAVREMAPKRLQTFFTRTERGYQVNKSVREKCVFVRHNLSTDPPFSKLDLISCRNVLIYFTQTLQVRATAAFHFALNLPGYLMLGRSESLVDPNHLFAVVDKDLKVFERSAKASKLHFPPTPYVMPTTPAVLGVVPSAAPVAPDLVRQAERVLIAHYVPPGVIIDSRGDILHFRGRTGPYLEPTPGQPQHNLLKMVREGLLGDLRTTLAQSRKSRSVVRKAGVKVKQNGTTVTCELVVMPLPPTNGNKDSAFIVLFVAEGKPAGKDARDTSPPRGKAKGGRVAELEIELVTTKEHLQSIVEEHQDTYDALTSANEELVSSNEELQSLNEELETAKEELQSSNEELATVNEELQTRNVELNRANSDIINVISSTDLPIVIVDSTRHIRRFTPKAVELMNLRPSDVGRPIDEIKSTLQLDDLDERIAAVIDNVAIKESEVQGRHGRWYRLQIRPYWTVDKRVDGAVVLVTDIDDLKRSVAEAERARDYAHGIVEAIPRPIVVLDDKLRVLSANVAFYEMFNVTKGETEARRFVELGNGHWGGTLVRDRLEETASTDLLLQGLEVACEPQGLGPRVYLLSVRSVVSPGGGRIVLLAIADITEQKDAEAQSRRRTEELRSANAELVEAEHRKNEFLAMLSHELRNPLAPITNGLYILNHAAPESGEAVRAREVIDRQVGQLTRLVDDLLDVTRLSHGKIQLRRTSVDLVDVVRRTIDDHRASFADKMLEVELRAPSETISVQGDRARLTQVIGNLLNNAAKFSSPKGKIWVSIEQEQHGQQVVVRVRDSGSGIAPAMLSKIFEPFTQVDVSIDRAKGGLGLGLSLVKGIIEMHGGSVSATSEGEGKGCEVTFRLPTDPGPIRSSVPPSHAGSHGPSKRILVIDDYVDGANSLRDMLRMIGHTVEIADSGRAGIEKAGVFKPDVILCDIGLPVMDGYEVARALRRDPAWRNTKLVAITGYAAPSDVVKAKAAGFDGHIAKPPSVDGLLSVLSDVDGAGSS